MRGFAVNEPQSFKGKAPLRSTRGKPLDFEGKKVLVTGSAHGLGRQIALDFAQAGATVAIHYLHSKKDALEVAQLCAGKGKKPILLKADVTKPGAAEKLVQDAGKKMGGLDVLVNNVGTYIKKPLAQMTRQEWQGVIDSNLNATFYCKACARHIKIQSHTHTASCWCCNILLAMWIYTINAVVCAYNRRIYERSTHNVGVCSRYTTCVGPRELQFTQYEG